MATGHFICNGVSKRHLDTLDLPPTMVCMGMGLYGVQGLCVTYRMFQGGEGTQNRKGKGSRHFWEEQAWKT